MENYDVFRPAPERQSKLNPKFSEPYAVAEKLQENKFKIYTFSAQAYEILHTDWLKRSSVMHRLLTLMCLSLSLSLSPILTIFVVGQVPNL